jgi:hypothetical protein
MAAILRTTAAVLAAYLAAWTVCFVVMFMLRGEAAPWDQYFSYFGLAWTFRGGEIPALVWASSLVVFVPLAAVLVFIAVRRARIARRAA